MYETNVNSFTTTIGSENSSTGFRLRVSITITIILLGTYVSTEASYFALYDDELLLERKIVIIPNNVIDITALSIAFYRENKRIGF